MGFLRAWGRAAALAVAIVAAVGMVGAAGAQTWDCGEVPGTVTATLSGGTLTVSGTGKMQDSYSPGAEEGNPIAVINLVIEDGITHIGQGAFYQWVGITYITLPNSLVSIEKYAFAYCSNLKSVTIPNGVISVGEGSFYGCTRLVSAVIGNSVTDIEGDVFNSCSTLTTITIGNSVTSIAIGAFTGCINLKSIVSLNPIPPPAREFGRINKNNVCLYVTESSIGAYVSAEYWEDFICTKVASFVTVAFDSRSGSAVIPQTILRDNRLLMPADPTRLGYTLEGWYTDTAYSNKWKFDTDVVTTSITLYAKWISGYIITWNVSGGTPIPTQTSVDSGGSIAAPPVITKAGYIFGGWYNDTGLTAEVTFPVTNVTEPKTFYAKWTVSAVTNIIGVPNTITVGNMIILNGIVVPADATNTTVVWSVISAGTTGAEIYNGNRLVALSDGTLILKATVPNGIASGTDYVQQFTIIVDDPDAVLSIDRVVPLFDNTGTVAIIPVAVLTAEFTAGPNPVGRDSRAVGFFWQGVRIASAIIYVYDASGTAVKPLRIRDTASNGKRLVGSWDMTDVAGRRCPPGAYLVRGTVKYANGKTEQVSVVVGVR